MIAVNVAALLIGVCMLYLSVGDIIDDRKGRRWPETFAVMLYAIGFLCVMVTALEAIAKHAKLWS